MQKIHWRCKNLETKNMYKILGKFIKNVVENTINFGDEETIFAASKNFKIQNNLDAWNVLNTKKET